MGKPTDSRRPPLPCRSGKLRVKIFPWHASHRKVHSDQYLAHDSPGESKARQGNGREAHKLSDRHLAPTDHCYHANYSLTFSHGCHMVRNFSLGSGRYVSSAPRG